MTLLQQVNPKETLLNLDARRLLARIYYDMKETTALESHIESSKIYLHRKKDIGYQKEAYSNFFRFLERIYKSRSSPNIIIESLYEEITQTKLLVEKEWLLVQAKKLGE